jgi:hypothetical protein
MPSQRKNRRRRQLHLRQPRLQKLLHQLHQQRQPRQPRRQQPQPVFLVLATTRSRLARAWAFLAQWLVQLETTHSHSVQVSSVRVVHDQPVPVVQVVRVAHLVRGAHLVHVLALPVAHSVLASVAEPLVRVEQQPVSVAHVLQVVLVLAVAATVVAPRVRSVRVEAVALQRPVSRSARNAKSSNREWLQALVAQLCHVATAQPFYAYVAVQASKTLQTRLRPLQPS